MRRYTQEEFDWFPVDEYGRKQCPAGDYTLINRFTVRSLFGGDCLFGNAVILLVAVLLAWHVSLVRVVYLVLIAPLAGCVALRNGARLVGTARLERCALFAVRSLLSRMDIPCMILSGDFRPKIKI